MVLGPFLRREMITSVRSARVIRDRLIALLPVTGVVAGCVFVWDEWGWDRTSVSGAAWFAIVAFTLTAFAQAGIAIGLVVGQVAPAIASERDRKCLDSLLATRFSSAEIVVGTMAAGLLRAANGLAATLPVVVLMVFLGGVDPRLVWLFGAGIASTALAVAAISVVASVGARTRGRAVSAVAWLLVAWLAFPSCFLGFKMRLWPGCPQWLTQPALWLVDSSPAWVVVPRPGSIVEKVLRMMALETAGAMALTLWAVRRLRPASRTLFEVEGRRSRLRVLRLSRRRRPRPPCTDDPVLWNAILTNRRGWIESRLIGLVWLGLIAVATSWLAVPAFRELVARGYGAASEAFTVPDEDASVPLLVKILPSVDPAPGQPRLAFNIALKQYSALFILIYGMSIMVGAAEGVKGERARDTWLGLIATPLTGWEILRAKMLGPVLRGRGGVLMLIGLWTVGLMAGAVHPLGFLAAVTGLAVSAWLYATIGLSSAWVTENVPGRSRGDRPNGHERVGHVLMLPVRLVAAVGAIFLLTLGPGALAWLSLLSYEDVHAVVHAGAYPLFDETALQGMVSARTVVGVWLAGTTALAAWAFSVTRAMCRDFDVAVGRPTRPRADARRS